MATKQRRLCQQAFHDKTIGQLDSARKSISFFCGQEAEGRSGASSRYVGMPFGNSPLEFLPTAGKPEIRLRSKVSQQPVHDYASSGNEHLVDGHESDDVNPL